MSSIYKALAQERKEGTERETERGEGRRDRHWKQGLGGGVYIYRGIIPNCQEIKAADMRTSVDKLHTYKGKL